MVSLKHDSPGQRDASKALREARRDKQRADDLGAEVGEVTRRLHEARTRNHFAESILIAFGGSA